MSTVEFSNSPELLSTEDNALVFSNPKRQARFELGVACAVFLWTDLRAAVDNGWGGPESAEKREWMVQAIIELYHEQVVAVEDVEYRLLGIMEDEFDTTLETDTAFDVARQIMGVYQDVSQERFDRIDALYKEFQAKEGQKVEVEINSDSEDDEDEHEHDLEMNDVDEAPDAIEAPAGPVIDDDGFELVQKKRR